VLARRENSPPDCFLILLAPTGIQIFLAPFRGFVGPVLGRLAGLDGLVFIPGVVVARHRHDGGVQNLPASRNAALPRQMAVEFLEERLHQARPSQSLAIEPDRLGVRHGVPKAQPEEPHEREPIAHLILDLVV
jgi:hypothetical protein